MIQFRIGKPGIDRQRYDFLILLTQIGHLIEPVSQFLSLLMICCDAVVAEQLYPLHTCYIPKLATAYSVSLP